MSLSESTELLLQLLGQRCAEGFDFGFLLGIDEVAVRAEGLKGRGDGDLVGEQVDTEIPKEHPQENQSAEHPALLGIQELSECLGLFFRGHPGDDVTSKAS